RIRHRIPRVLVLLAPTLELPLEVAQGIPIVAESNGAKVHAVQPRKSLIRGIPDFPPLRRGLILQDEIPEDPPRLEFHDVKLGAEDIFLQTLAEYPRYRHVGRSKGAQYSAFPIHRVRRFEQLSGRLASQYVVAAGADELVGGV